jgi:hypothetical protein
MDEDLEDAPPLLVAANEPDEVPDLVDAKLGDLSLVKVPITIVTGAYGFD